MKNNLLKSTMLLLLSFGLTIFMSAQTVFPLEAGTDGIGTALLDAQSGDIIELTTSGGVYIETGSDSIMVDVTIRAAEGLAEKPIIKGGGTLQDLDVLYVYEGGLNVRGIVFDGGAYVISTKARAGIVSTDFSLRVDNCDFRNWTQRAIYISDGTLTPLDSVVVTNTTFVDGVKQAIYLKTTRTGSGIFPGAFRYCKVYNCLMANLSSDGDGHATYIEPGSRDIPGEGWPVVIVDHVTAYNVTRGISTYTTPGALVQNCIVAAPVDPTRTAIDVQSGRWTTDPLPPISTIKNCVYVGGLNLQGSSSVLSIAENVDSATAIFKDVTNGEFRLAADSPGKNGATDGKDVGYLAPAGPPTLPVIACPGFEEDTAFIAWTQDWDNSSINTNMAFVKSGTKSLKVGPGAGGRAQYPAIFTPGTEVSLLAWGKSDGPLTQGAYIGFRASDEFVDLIEVEGAGEINADEWVQQCASMTIPETTVELIVYFWYSGDDNNATSIYIDDYEFVWGNVCVDNTKVSPLKYNSFVNVYPNPTTGPAQISIGKEISKALSFEMFDVTGKLVSRVNNLNGQRNINIDISSSPAGIYFGKINYEGGSQVFKILKK